MYLQTRRHVLFRKQLDLIVLLPERRWERNDVNDILLGFQFTTDMEKKNNTYYH